MSSHSTLEKMCFPRKAWLFIKTLPTATSPDARWGTVQILLSFFFFFFGLAIAAISLYDTSFGGKPAMIVAIVLGSIGFLFLVWAIWMGWHYWHKFDEGSILIVTKDRIQYSADKAQIKDNQIIITTDKYEIKISQTNTTKDAENGKSKQ